MECLWTGKEISGYGDDDDDDDEGDLFRKKVKKTHRKPPLICPGLEQLRKGFKEGLKTGGGGWEGIVSGGANNRT